MDYQDLGKRIRKHRTAQGLTQEGLAERIEVSTSFVGHLERGTRKASLETIVAISNALHLSLDYLFGASLDTTVLGPAPAKLTAQQNVAFKEIVTAISDNLSNWK